MPQVFNPKVQQENDTVFGPTSRHASINSFSSVAQKRMEMAHKVDQRTVDFQLGISAKHSETHISTLNRLRKQLMVSLQKHKAYKEASKMRCFSTLMSQDRKKALNTNYSFRAMRTDIKEALWHMNPTYIREHNAEIQKEKCKETQEVLIKRNLKRIPTRRTKRRRENRIMELRLLKGDTAIQDMERDHGAWFISPTPTKEIEILSSPERSMTLNETGLITKPQRKSKKSPEPSDGGDSKIPIHQIDVDKKDALVSTSRKVLPPIETSSVTSDSFKPKTKSKQRDSLTSDATLPPIKQKTKPVAVVAQKKYVKAQSEKRDSKDTMLPPLKKATDRKSSFSKLVAPPSDVPLPSIDPEP